MQTAGGSRGAVGGAPSTPDSLSKARSNAKRDHTNLCKVIMEYLNRKDCSSVVVKEYRHQINGTRQAVFDAHHRYKMALNVPEDQVIKFNDYLKDIDDKYSSVCAAIASFQTRRRPVGVSDASLQGPLTTKVSKVTKMSAIPGPQAATVPVATPTGTAPKAQETGNAVATRRPVDFNALFPVRTKPRPRGKMSLDNESLGRNSLGHRSSKPDFIYKDKLAMAIPSKPRSRVSSKAGSRAFSTVEERKQAIADAHAEQLKKEEAETEAKMAALKIRLRNEKQASELRKQKIQLESELALLEEESQSIQQDLVSDGTETNSELEDASSEDESSEDNSLPPDAGPTDHVVSWIQSARPKIVRHTKPAPFTTKTMRTSWIEEREEPSRRKKTNRDAMITLLPKHEITPFDGDPLKWPFFISAFKDLVHDVVSSDSHRLSLLRQYLTPDVQLDVGTSLTTTNQYWEALEELEENYGHPHIVARAHLDSLLNFPSLSENDRGNLIRFIRQLRGTVKVLQSSGYTHELLSGVALNQLVLKLPRSIQSSWGRHSYEQRPHLVNIADLATWLQKIEMGEKMLLASQASVPKQTPRKEEKRSGKGQVKDTRGPTINHTFTKPDGKPKKPSKTSKFSPAPCFSCGQPRHSVFLCKPFLNRSLSERVALVKEKGRCFKCLGHGHVEDDCTSKFFCLRDNCGKSHHTLLHGAELSRSKPREEETHAISVSSPTVLLSVVKVKISIGLRSVTTWALLDNGATCSLIREDVANLLHLDGPTEEVKFRTFHGKDPSLKTRKVSFNIAPCDEDSFLQVVDARTVPNLNVSRRPTVRWSEAREKWKHLSDLPWHAMERSEVTVLIGMDVVDAHIQLEVRRPPTGVIAPHGVRTQLGWSVVGNAPSEALSVNHLHLSPYETLHDLVKNMWRTDALITQPIQEMALTKEETKAVEQVDATFAIEDSRLVAGLPWKEEDVFLPDNYPMAFRRLLSVERRLKREPDFAKTYQKVIEDYEVNGFSRLVQPSEAVPPGRIWYLPHHGVTHPLKPGKVRVVFDASAEYKGYSLNNSLLPGPNLLNESTQILTAFRLRAVGVSADIKAFFPQIMVKTEDQSFLRYLWRSPGETEEPRVYQMTRQIFGAISSPFVCSYSLRKMADVFKERFPTAAPRVSKNFYVDNFLDSFDTEKQAIDECKKLVDLIGLGGFHLTQWLSSSRRLLATLPESVRLAPEVDLDFDQLPTERTLGIRWNADTDCFCFKVKLNGEARTKRQIVSQIASVYDPLGFLTPLVFTLKLLIQDIWRSGTDWDEDISPTLLPAWQQWITKSPSIETIFIPRPLTSQLLSNAELHVFSDASEMGFGAVLYLRFVEKSTEIRFLSSRTRVAPIKSISIPKLELQGAVIGYRLAASFARHLELNIVRITYWTDSTTVLQWIKSTKSRWQAFVGNRVGEILEGSNPGQWRHVPGKQNPADDCSRGLPADALNVDHRWFAGPDFLLEPEENWPQDVKVNEPSPDDPELSVPRWIGATGIDHSLPQPISDLIGKTSTLKRLKHVVGFILRFVGPRLKKDLKRGTGKILETSELEAALKISLQVAQKDSFGPELKALRLGHAISGSSRLASLSVFLDAAGLIRVGGRLSRSELPFDQKHPILLDPSHHLTKLIIQDFHHRSLHAGVEHVVAELRTNFWILSCRKAVRHFVRSCPVCRRWNSQPNIPLMASLPPERLKSFERPFTSTGVDFFGPLTIVVGRRTEKRWVCLFTCLVVRAVHLEVCPSLDLDSFVLAFRRFVARRGKPKIVFSDNGTNFVAGERILREQLEGPDAEKFVRDRSDDGIEWRFSPPSGPHFGGIWERLVRSCKAALRIVFNNRTVSAEILQTVIVEVEALLNGRPLTHVSVDPNDPLPLTPNNFLIGQALAQIPFGLLEPEEMTSKHRWRAAQAIVDHFWRRWMKEYVPNLIERRKWLNHRKNLKKDDVVIIIEPNTPRGLWPLGRIVKTLPGSDGVVRVALVRCKNGEKIRPVAKLCLLEEAAAEEN